MKRLYTLLAGTATVLAANAQISITDSLTVGTIATLLEGIGVTVTNVQVNCPERAMGHFNGSSELAIAQGLVLTSGIADSVAGPVGAFASFGWGNPGDPDLDMDAGNGGLTLDGCALEFDCVPQGDTLLFNFSFGSEEYQEFVGSSFNDAFAIYLSGPGYTPRVNVAAIPGGTIVAINNVNDGTNSAYYHNNETAPSGQFVAYDGFTTNLTAFAVVQPGQSYHFKVVIADMADMVFDSGVFLEAFSFRSPLFTTGVDGATDERFKLAMQGDELLLSGPAGLGAGQPVLVHDMGGSLVFQGLTTGPRTTLAVGGLKQGLYVVHLPGSGLAPQRFVRE
ncbi:MAG: choice-of-anchor L domain-containing protein [Flavobacteriales bacterium]|nr:choice-of-anchor L domain-containing protein [Flavobacteriales bacterium]